jgi:hypothetical protein
MDDKDPTEPTFSNSIVEASKDPSGILISAIRRGVTLRFLLMLLTWVLSFFFDGDLGFLTTVVFAIDTIRMPICWKLPKIIWEIASRDGPPEIDPVSELLMVTTITLTNILAILFFMAIGDFGPALALLGHFVPSEVLALLGHLAFSGVLLPFLVGLVKIVVHVTILLAYKTSLVEALVRVLCSAWDAIHELVFRLTSRESLSGSTAYTYKCLRAEESEIRLIRITKSTPFSRPRYSLITTPLATAPPYDAISYTWDKQECENPVAFHGEKLDTTLNAKKILQQRGSCLRTVHLWVDAICINQRDKSEKSSQMALMGKIYSQARRTLIWLENDNPRSSEAMRINVAVFIIGTIARYFLKDKLILDFVCLQHLAPGKCPSLEDFLKHRYWHRAWVIQEVARGRQVHILYGNQFLDWKRVHRALSLMTQPPLSKHILKNGIVVGVLQATRAMATYSALYNGVPFLDKVRRARSLGPVNLRAALEWSSAAEASEPEDKVFALQGLVLEDSDLDSQLAHVLRDNCNSGPSEICTRLAQYLLSTDPEYLFRKAGVGWQRDITDLPSWVPDWTHKPGMMQFGDVPYRAGGDGNFAVEILDCGLLRLPIVEIAALVALTPSFTSELTDSNGSGPITSFYHSAVKIAERLPETWSPVTGQSRDEGFWRTIIGNLVRQTPTSQLMYPAPAEWGGLYQRWITSALGPKGDYRSIMKPSGGDGDDFGMNFAVSCQHRCFAITDTGHMALVPEFARTGDIVCVSSGLRWPLLLRKKESEVSLELVGSCYVHGLMDGEGLKQKNWKKVRVF